MFSKTLRILLPMAGQFMGQRPSFQKALTPLMLLHSISPLGQQPNRTLTSKTLTKSLELVSNSSKEIKTGPGNSLQLQLVNNDRPLSILLCWLMSQKKHIMKYAQFYLDQGFDVLTVRISPWQLLWPMSGTQVVAKDLLNFLGLNTHSYKTTMLHGFSVGGYLWGEVLNMMSKEPVKYQPVIDRIAGQIWDSVVDFEGIPIGLPNAVFPNNAVLRNSLEKYVKYHMMKFHDVATRHYLNSSAQYHQSIVRAPALFLCSLDDPIGPAFGMFKVQNKWEANGMTVYVKAWKSSPHVNHLHHHPEDYKQEMKAFLEKLGLVPYPEKFQQVSSQ